jgi:hypothetical protein
VAGTCEVPINEAADRPAEDISRPTKAHHYYDFRTGTLAEVVDSIRKGGNMRLTTAEDVMHHDNGRLRGDLDIPYWERVTGWEQNQHHWLRSPRRARKQPLPLGAGGKDLDARASALHGGDAPPGEEDHQLQRQQHRRP